MGKKVFSVYMGDPDSSSHAELDLPATPWELIDALDKLRLEDGRESYWQVEDIGRYGFLAPLLDDSDLYQFNALAEQLSTFDHVEDIAFEGLVQMEVDKLCQTNGGELTLQRLLDLAYSVDCCHVVPEVRDDAALGRFYVENEFLPELEQVAGECAGAVGLCQDRRKNAQGRTRRYDPERLCSTGSRAAAGPAQLGQAAPEAAVYDPFPLRQ